MNHEQAVRLIWQPAALGLSDHDARLRELVRCATLAPSSHNTQCWRFAIDALGITIAPDWQRRCPVVDPDDHHLYVSLGCAAENLIQAAGALGYAAEPAQNTPPDQGLRIELRPARAVSSPLVDAIAERQSTRAAFDGKSLMSDELCLLEGAGRGNGVRVVLLTERAVMETVIDYVVQGNTAQLANPAFVRELKTWVRFGDAEAIARGDGLWGRCSGQPSVPRWFAGPIFRLLLRASAGNDQYARLIRSSAGIAVFVSDHDGPGQWIEVGRCYQRFALLATTLGIRNAFVNQPVEEAALRPAFLRALGLDGVRADLVVRFGRGRTMPRSLRRPLDDVIDHGP